MAEESKTSKRQNIILPNLPLDTTKALTCSSSVPSSPTGLRKATILRQNCLCSPTTHPGSFRCRYHRNANLIRNSMSVGSKLTDLGEKQTNIHVALQGQLVAGHDQAS